MPMPVASALCCHRRGIAQMLRFSFRRKREVKADSDGTRKLDLERFLAAMKALSDQEMGMLLAMATVIRMELRRQGLFPDETLDIASRLPESRRTAVRSAMVGLALQYQKQDHPCTAAAMIWAHSLRAAQFPELRPLGCDLWSELKRGHPHVLDAFNSLEETTGESLPLGSLLLSQYIPAGLESSEPNDQRLSV
jgi:hypothetical protein